MDPNDDDGGLLNISLSLSDDEENATNATDQQQDSGSRTALSEKTYQTLRREYRPMIANGEVCPMAPADQLRFFVVFFFLGLENQSDNTQLWKHMKLPLPQKKHKTEMQSVLHAVEELYFFRRYEDAMAFIKRLRTETAEELDEDTLTTLGVYEKRLAGKLGVK